MTDTFISAWSFCWEPVEIFPISCKMIVNLIVLNKELFKIWGNGTVLEFVVKFCTLYVKNIFQSEKI